MKEVSGHDVQLLGQENVFQQQYIHEHRQREPEGSQLLQPDHCSDYVPNAEENSPQNEPCGYVNKISWSQSLTYIQ